MTKTKQTTTATTTWLNPAHEILHRARSGIGPTVLIHEHNVPAKVLRRILSGYRPYSRDGGSEKFWNQYYADHEAEIASLRAGTSSPGFW